MFLRIAFLLFLLNITLGLNAQWKAAYSPLNTVWSMGYRPSDALPEYPRPQMVREKWLNLNGLWEFTLENTLTKNSTSTGQILVPFPVESALSGVKQSISSFHEMVYRRTFRIPENWVSQRVLLHFGAVDYETAVYVNGKKAGSHKGGYDAFSFDITDLLQGNAEQKLEVRVTDFTNQSGQPVGKQRLNPNGIFYTPVSGIWQTVWLEPVPPQYIRSMHIEIQPNLTQVIIRPDIFTSGRRDLRATVRATGDGFIVSQSFGSAESPHMISIPQGKLWTPDNPFLYSLEIILADANNEVVDKVTSYFGLRSIGIGKDEKGFNRLLLNGKPLFQLGVLDQGYWPEGLYTAPSEAAVINNIQTLKNMGFNMIRKHVKVEPARWYYLCDKLGMLIWQDMPNAANKTDEDKEQFEEELKTMVKGLINHPSIVTWVPFNEGWGQFDTEKITAKIYEWDPSRLVNSASGWTDYGSGDLKDIHAYPGPEAPKPDENRVSVLGEFGGLGFNVAGHMWTNDGWGYQLFSTPEDLLLKYENLYRDLLPLIDTAGLSAAVYTQISDIETENNGLMTYDRKVLKIDPHLMQLAHQGILPPRPLTTGRIFSGSTKIALKAATQKGQIQYNLFEPGLSEKWKNYKKPLKFRKSKSFYTRVLLPDGKKSRYQQYTFTKVQAAKPITEASKTPGLALKTFEGSWDSIPDFDLLKATNEQIVTLVGLEDVKSETDFGLVFSGLLNVPATGTYTFYCKSDDGSRLELAGKSIITNDGIHGIQSVAGSIALKKGLHTFKLEFFQKKGGKGLELCLEGSDGTKAPIPQSWFFH